MEVPHNVRVWATRPPTAIPPATGKQGHPLPRLRLTPAAPAAVRVEALAAALPPSAWQVAQIQDGSKGPLVAAVAFVRAVAVRDGRPGPAVWVVPRRALDAPRELTAYLIKKDELGLDHDEVRGWRGWHHHTTMTLLAQHFLVRLRGRLGGNSPGAERAPGAPSAQRDARGSAARPGGDAGLHPGDSVPQLRRRLRPPPAPPPAAAAPGQLLSQLTLYN
jgi:hypothetical protein